MDSSRIGLLGQGCVVMILAACAGCSSSSSPATPDSGGGMTTPPAGDGGADKVVVGDTTMPCKPTYPVATSVLVIARRQLACDVGDREGNGPRIPFAPHRLLRR